MFTQINVSGSRLGVLPFQRKFQFKAKILSCLSHRRRPSFFFLHARISVASSSGHQTAEMGAVTLHSGLGNPTLRQRHNARRRVGDHFTDQEILPCLVTTHLDYICLPNPSLIDVIISIRRVTIESNPKMNICHARRLEQHQHLNINGTAYTAAFQFSVTLKSKYIKNMLFT